MKDWIRISLHFVDYRNGKKENGGISVFDWVDLSDWDLLQIWMGMRCEWFAACFDADFRRFGGMIICCRFHDSDWISIISDADRHYFLVSTPITLSPMPLNDLWGGWEVSVVGCVWHKEEARASISDLDDLQELRCLFVREGWSEYLRWLWRHPCIGMHMEDTHRWDWTCLNNIHSGWESLSRVMWWGFQNV